LGNGVGPSGQPGPYNFSDDGTTVRPLGLPAPLSIFLSPTLTYDAATPGGWQPSILGGYLIYFVLYNPVTGHVGNRALVFNSNGIAPVVVPSPGGGSLKITNLPSATDLGLPGSGLSGEYSAYIGPDGKEELVLGIGRTNDNGQVPYWIVDNN